MHSSGSVCLLYTFSRGKGRQLLQLAMRKGDRQEHEEGHLSSEMWQLACLRKCHLLTLRRTQREPIGFARSGRLNARAKWYGGMQRTPHWNFACHASKGPSLLASWGCVCPHLL